MKCHMTQAIATHLALATSSPGPWSAYDLPVGWAHRYRFQNVSTLEIWKLNSKQQQQCLNQIKFSILWLPSMQELFHLTLRKSLVPSTLSNPLDEFLDTKVGDSRLFFKNISFFGLTFFQNVCTEMFISPTVLAMPGLQDILGQNWRCTGMAKPAGLCHIQCALVVLRSLLIWFLGSAPACCTAGRAPRKPCSLNWGCAALDQSLGCSLPVASKPRPYLWASMPTGLPTHCQKLPSCQLSLAGTRASQCQCSWADAIYSSANEL